MSTKNFIVQVTKHGGIQMLHEDEFRMQDFGRCVVFRASEVDFDQVTQSWFVKSFLTGLTLAYGFSTRERALEWEKSYFQPGGPGWIEIGGDINESLH